jgi:hypothetical protein
MYVDNVDSKRYNIPMAKKQKFNWDKQLQYAQEALDKNKALIESTSRGTNANKAPDWSRRPSKNKSRLQ